MWTSKGPLSCLPQPNMTLKLETMLICLGLCPWDLETRALTINHRGNVVVLAPFPLVPHLKESLEEIQP